MSDAQTLTETALDLANHGWPVFPCGASKTPCRSKDEGGRGLYDATLDPDEIRRLFSHPRAKLIGVPTGDLSGIDALDLDYRHGAAKWEQANLHRLPETRIHGTRSSGRHYLFHHAPGIANTAGKIAQGVDVRGQGGYIVWWPAHGVRTVSDAPTAHWPDWLLSVALPPPEQPRLPRTVTAVRASKAQLQEIIDAALLRVSHAPEGAKHFTLRNSALLLGGIQQQSGFTTEAAIGWLIDALPSSVRDWEAARKTAAWGLEHGAARPLEVAGQAAPPTPEEKENRRKLARVAVNLIKAGADPDATLRQIEILNAGLTPSLAHDDLTGLTEWAKQKARIR